MVDRRYVPIYRLSVVRTARGGRQRHLFRTTGTGFPASLCGDAQATPTGSDDSLAVRCPQCRLTALSEITLALEDMGEHLLSAYCASVAANLSYETPTGQTA